MWAASVVQPAPQCAHVLYSDEVAALQGLPTQQSGRRQHEGALWLCLHALRKEDTGEAKCIVELPILQTIKRLALLLAWKVVLLLQLPRGA